MPGMAMKSAGIDYQGGLIAVPPAPTFFPGYL